MSSAVAGVRRAIALWRLFRNEQTDPVPFYRRLAAEAAADLDRRHGPLAGQTIVDLGCGPGHYTRALRDRGATVIPVDNDPATTAVDENVADGAHDAAVRVPGGFEEREELRRKLLPPERKELDHEDFR